MAPSVPIYEIYAIRFATNPARTRGQDFIGDPDPQQPHVMDFFCWLLVNGGEATMVDVGAGRASMEAHGVVFGRCPTEALAALGFAPDQVRCVLLTHLHFDHVGNMDLFPGAHFHLPRREMEYATGPDMSSRFLRRAYGAQEIGMAVSYLFQDRLTLHGDVAEIAPGLSLHRLGGHTAGQAVVRVRTARGWVVLASDTLHYYEELERGIPFAIAHSTADMLAAHAAVRGLADSDAHIVPAHDPLVMDRYPAAGPGLEGFVVRLDVAPA